MDREELFINMLKNEKNISHYLMSNPFSSLNNLNYGTALNAEIFEKKFLVYDSLQEVENEIIEYLQDISQNTVLITGYQGCGKTIFVNYLVRHLQQLYQRRGLSCAVEEIDFEKEDEEDKGNPFKKTIVRIVVEKICEMTEGQMLEKKILNFIIDTYYANLDVFKKVENKVRLQKLFAFLKDNCETNFNTNFLKKDELYGFLKENQISQLLILWSYIVICKEYRLGRENFVEILLLDNLDDIYKNEYTEKFIKGLKKYHELGSQFISQIRINNERVRYNLYTNFNFILCLRDTSVAKFSYHFTTRAMEFFHKDISEKVDKKTVMDNKINFLNEIHNEKLKKKAKYISYICNDQYTIKRIFPLYNNDYRTAVKSICNVLEQNHEFTKEYCAMIKTEDSAAHFGAHGIILRLILNSFEKQDYFRAIGSYNVSNEYETEEGKYQKHDLVDYSIPRVILTYLYNYQTRHQDNFLNNLPDTMVNLKNIFDDFRKIIDCKNIAEKLEAMYSLHSKKDWNHLININATYSITDSNINNIFERYKKGGFYEENDGTIQITCAGRIFVQRITTHYEYFACRYFENSVPLFLDQNLEIKEGQFLFEKNIADVYKKVSECVKKAYEFDMRIVNEYFGGNLERFKDSKYLFKRTQTHAERIINHNISYIDAYRHYIIRRGESIKGKENLTESEKNIISYQKDICKKILFYMNLYIDLMDQYIGKKYFSRKAEDLVSKYREGYRKVGDNYLSDEIISFDPRSWL